ncbi:MAG TPA: hypothetical protein VJ760_03035 [Nitrospiraceae bacterium]|nr:hypothetical protein [Nitrospiraceae bacterium]
MRHAAESNAGVMDTLYLVEFEATQAGTPAQGIMQWKVTALETFAKRAGIEKKLVQRLRTQK